MLLLAQNQAGKWAVRFSPWWSKWSRPMWHFISALDMGAHTVLLIAAHIAQDLQWNPSKKSQAMWKKKTPLLFRKPRVSQSQVYPGQRFAFPKVPHVFVFSHVSRCAGYLFFSTFLDFSSTSDDFQCIFVIFVRPHLPQLTEPPSPSGAGSGHLHFHSCTYWLSCLLSFAFSHSFPSISHLFWNQFLVTAAAAAAAAAASESESV